MEDCGYERFMQGFMTEVDMSEFGQSNEVIAWFTFVDIIPSCPNNASTDLNRIDCLNFRHTIRIVGTFGKNSSSNIDIKKS